LLTREWGVELGKLGKICYIVVRYTYVVESRGVSERFRICGLNCRRGLSRELLRELV